MLGMYLPGRPKTRGRLRKKIAKGGRVGDLFLPDALIPSSKWREEPPSQAILQNLNEDDLWRNSLRLQILSLKLGISPIALMRRESRLGPDRRRYRSRSAACVPEFMSQVWNNHRPTTTGRARTKTTASMTSIVEKHPIGNVNHCLGSSRVCSFALQTTAPRCACSSTLRCRLDRTSQSGTAGTNVAGARPRERISISWFWDRFRKPSGWS